MSPALFNRMIQPVARRLRLMVARAVVQIVNDGTLAQSLQVNMLAGETAEGVERFQEYGFTSVPHAGAEACMVFVGGARSHGIVIAVEDRRYRLTGLLDGEVALYDDLGNVVKLGREALAITGVAKVIVSAPLVELGGEGGAAVARVGDTVSGGVITSGSAKVSAL